MQNNLYSTLPTIFTIFGATGDLTKRKLIPVLFPLYSGTSFSRERCLEDLLPCTKVLDILS